MRQQESRNCVYFSAVSLIVIVVALGSLGCSRRAAAVVDSVSSVGSALDTSALHLVDLAGQSFDLRKSSAGRVHVAVFTRTDCPVSNQCAPEIRELYETFHSQGVDIFLIYVDPFEKPDSIREHLRQYEYPCPGLRDPEHTLVAQTGATVTPEAVVFDSDWRIAYQGRITDQYVDVGKSKAGSIRRDLKDAIEATLAGRRVAEPATRAVGCYIKDLR